MARRSTVANSGEFKLEGIDDLKEALAEIAGQAATGIGRTADRKAAQYVASIMKQTAPYDDKRKAGKGSSKPHLRDQVTVKLAKARSPTTITYTIGIGKAFWGAFQEFGTAHMGARPWMRPAFDATVKTALDLQISGLRDGIETAAKKAAKL